LLFVYRLIFFFFFFLCGCGCGMWVWVFIPLVLLFEPKDLCIKGGWDSIILCRSGGTICLPCCRPVFRLAIHSRTIFSPNSLKLPVMRSTDPGGGVGYVPSL
jgi:hypothetical protein